MPRSKALFSLLAVPLIALLLIGCGGDDKDSSSDGGSSSGDSSSSSSGSSGSGGSSSSGDDRAVSLENCKEYTSFATTAASAMGAGSSGQFKFDKGAFDKMVKASPKEIRADMEVVVGALVSYFEVLEKAGLTGDPSKIDPAKLQAAQADLEKAAAKFEDKKVTEASERIEAFFEKNCSQQSTTDSSTKRPGEKSGLFCRPSLAYNRDMDGDHIAGIDLGGTKILSVCLDPSDAVVGRDYRETLAIEGPDAVIARMAESARAAADGRSLRAAGISTPGPVDLKRGLVTTPPNLPGWQDVALGYLIAQRLGVPAWIENDANAAALAEQRLGAGEGSNHMLLVTIGTGVGGGLVLDGRLYHGASGGAGEIGHMLVEPGGRLCGCGARGHLEAMASGRALNADAQELANVEPKGHVAEIARREGVTPDARILDMAAEAGDVSAREAIQRAGAYLGAGLTNLVNVFNPEVIVIGGSIRKSELYMESALTVLHRDAFRQHLADVRITEALLGDEAPAIGAALVAQDHLSSQRRG